MCGGGGGCVCVHVFVIIQIQNNQKSQDIDSNHKKITGKSIKNHKKAAKLQYNIHMNKATKYSNKRLQYKLQMTIS